jgi:serine protease Do
VGERVFAIGNPFGHGHTVTKGIISAKERIIPISQFANYLQTDTPINPGNSGGPLINTAGQVIGINTAINAAAQGIGFAIPINYVKRILPDLRTKGAVTRGFIGINITELTPAMAKSLKLKENLRGVLVSDVTEGEPAQKAGIQAYDIITEVDGKTVVDGRQLVAAISSVAPGEKVNIKALRLGKEKEFSVEVSKRPTRESLTMNKPKSGTGGPNLKLQAASGLTLDELDADTRRELGLPGSTAGVVVTKVGPGSPAEDSGLRRGDVIVEVDQRPSPNLDAFYRVVKEERVYLLRIRRGEGFAITSLDLTAANLRKNRDE